MFKMLSSKLDSKEHCAHYETDIVICYCHYCLDRLIAGVDGRHLVELLL